DSKARSSIRGWAGSQVSAVAIRRNGPTGCEGPPAPFAAANSGLMAHLGHTVAVRDFERMTRAIEHEARRPLRNCSLSRQCDNVPTRAEGAALRCLVLPGRCPTTLPTSEGPPSP